MMQRYSVLPPNEKQALRDLVDRHGLSVVLEHLVTLTEVRAEHERALKATLPKAPWWMIHARIDWWADAVSTLRKAQRRIAGCGM
jgi:hypothetical protein